MVFTFHVPLLAPKFVLFIFIKGIKHYVGF